MSIYDLELLDGIGNALFGGRELSIVGHDARFSSLLSSVPLSFPLECRDACWDVFG